MVKLVLLLVLIFELSTAHKGHKAHNCPPIIDWPGEHAHIQTQTFRYIAEVDYSRCVGKIAKCIYTVHLKYYCFSGKITNLTPHEMYPTYKKKTSETDMQDVFTGPYGYNSGSPFEFQQQQPGNFQPIESLKMCPGDWEHRLVCQGLEIAIFGAANNSAGSCPTLKHHHPVEIHLHLGDYITEALLRIGYVLDRLTLVETRNDKNHEVFSVGGPYGNAFDATPDPKEVGPCILVNLNGTVLETTAGDYINSIGFFWSCLGLPDSFY